MSKPQEEKNRRYPVPLRRAAKTLEVSYTHLWLVMNGQRKSQPLRRRYAELVRTTAAGWTE